MNDIGKKSRRHGGLTWLFAFTSTIFLLTAILFDSRCERLRDKCELLENDYGEMSGQAHALRIRCDKLKQERDRQIELNEELADQCRQISAELLESCKCRDAYHEALTECQLEKPRPILPRPDVPPPADVDPPKPIDTPPVVEPKPLPELCPCGCGKTKVECPRRHKRENREKHRKSK